MEILVCVIIDKSPDVFLAAKRRAIDCRSTLLICSRFDGYFCIALRSYGDGSVIFIINFCYIYQFCVSFNSNSSAANCETVINSSVNAVSATIYTDCAAVDRDVTTSVETVVFTFYSDFTAVDNDVAAISVDAVGGVTGARRVDGRV